MSAPNSGFGFFGATPVSRVDAAVAALTEAVDQAEDTWRFLQDVDVPVGLEERQGQTIVLANAVLETKIRCGRVENDCVRLLGVLHDMRQRENR